MKQMVIFLFLEVQFFKQVRFLRSFLGRFLEDANILKYFNGVLQLYDALFLLKITSLMGFNFYHIYMSHMSYMSYIAEYNMKTFFLKNYTQNVVEKLVLDPFLKN